MRRLNVLAVGVVILLGCGNASLRAQSSDKSIDVGGHFSVLHLSEFDATNTGIGLNTAWQVGRHVALGGSVTWFNGDASAPLAERIAKQSRTLGLAGARYGVRSGLVDVFARAHAGVLRFAALGPSVCVAIAPAPLECQLAAGYTAFATDLGGGVALNAAEHLQFRVEAGDLLVRYGMDASRTSGEPSGAFTSHNLQVTSAIAWRF